jgi:polysaccharide export outer membrane protein
MKCIKHVLKKPSLVSLILLSMSLSGCGSLLNNWLPSAGPSYKDVSAASGANNDASLIELIDMSSTVTQRLQASDKKQLFSEVFATSATQSYVAKPGDVLEISIWEASPALLFSAGPSITAISGISSNTTSRNSTIPEQMVNAQGMINMPFAGPLMVSGKTTTEIEKIITDAIKGKANYPQVMVRMTRNTTSNVTIVGEVGNSVLMPLTPKGERLLDAIATAGGVKQPINKITIQLSRNSQVQTIALEKVIQDPKQNIALVPGDVLTAYYQPFSFTVLGATGKNDEINFEAQGISLTQALGRIGGLQDNRADAKGLFIFRFEDPTTLPTNQQPKALTADGKVPVVYRVDMNDPATFFVAQNFNIKHKDVIYVSNAPAAELQKFLNIVVSVVYPLVNVGIINK